jgi:hypothetical protein
MIEHSAGPIEGEKSAAGEPAADESGTVSKPWSMRREILVRLRGNWRYLVTWIFDRLFDRIYDRRFGIASAKRRSLIDLGFADHNCMPYQPVSYLDFKEVMRLAPIRAGHDVFIDFGAGMGRAVCIAATYPFRSVIGVELSAELAELARANVGRIRDKLRCGDIQIFTADATQFPISGDVSFVSFVNPFRGPLMAKVLANIALSLRANPRRLTIFCYGSPADEGLLSPFYDAPWLRLRSQNTLPTGCAAAFFETKVWTGHQPQSAI